MVTSEGIQPDLAKIGERVRDRVLCQLIEAVAYEEIILPRELLFPDGMMGGRVAIPGKTKHGESVDYVFEGKRQLTFDRIRVRRGTVRRRDSRGKQTAATLPLFVQEVLGQVLPDERLAVLLDELEQTLVKDIQAQMHRAAASASRNEPTYDEWESLLDGHPYHPCYKSRIGFHLRENQLYGPEFQADLRPIWLAVAKTDSVLSSLDGIDYVALVKEELGSETFAAFAARLRERGLDEADYWLMPVHPWQWENVVLPVFHSQLADQTIVMLGTGEDVYRAQQSIRSWANATAPEKSNLKLALGITNTSTRRMLAKHTVLNAPLVTNWLLALAQEDETIQELGVQFLGEFAGVTYEYEKLPAAAQLQAYGSLGVIWRQSVHRFINAEEQALPFHALCLMVRQEPAISPWIGKYGLEGWTRRLLDVTVTPLIHMLYAHGLALESHAQNIILIHREGWPARVALKDFHDGVRFSKGHLPRPDVCPDLHREPAHHRAINRHSYMQTDDLAAVKDFLHSAFFFVCLGELAITLAEAYGLPEEAFWKMAADVIYRYQEEHPQYRQAYDWYDLFSETIMVEQLARRRMWKDAEVEPKPVPNPLYHYRRRQGGEA